MCLRPNLRAGSTKIVLNSSMSKKVLLPTPIFTFVSPPPRFCNSLAAIFSLGDKITRALATLFRCRFSLAAATNLELISTATQLVKKGANTQV